MGIDSFTQWYRINVHGKPFEIRKLTKDDFLPLVSNRQETDLLVESIQLYYGSIYASIVFSAVPINFFLRRKIGYKELFSYLPVSFLPYVYAIISGNYYEISRPIIKKIRMREKQFKNALSGSLSEEELFELENLAKFSKEEKDYIHKWIDDSWGVYYSLKYYFFRGLV